MNSLHFASPWLSGLLIPLVLVAFFLWNQKARHRPSLQYSSLEFLKKLPQSWKVRMRTGLFYFNLEL